MAKNKDFFNFNKAINWNKLKDPKVLKKLEKIFEEKKLTSERASLQASERASRRDNMKKTYQFDVPCVYYYEIDADTEEQARKILLDKGGLDIDGDLCLDEDNYKRAELVGVLQPQANKQKG